MSRIIRDSKGNQLFPFLLRVLERDDRGRPTSCQACYDEDRLSLDPADEARNHFILVWAPADCELEPVAGEFERIRAEQRELHGQVVEARREIKTVTDENRRLTTEIEAKTRELRRLQDERDPDRVERLVAARVAAATASLEEQLTAARRESAGKDSTITELQGAKRRLREALDRARGERR